MRVFFQSLNDSQRYYLKNIIKVKRKRILQIILATYIASIKNEIVVVVVVFFRSTLTIFVTFKSIVVFVFYVYDLTIICFYCVKLNYKKFNCFNLNKFSTIRIYKIVNNSNEKMKKVSKLVDEKKKV